MRRSGFPLPHEGNPETMAWKRRRHSDSAVAHHPPRDATRRAIHRRRLSCVHPRGSLAAPGMSAVGTARAATSLMARAGAA